MKFENVTLFIAVEDTKNYLLGKKWQNNCLNVLMVVTVDRVRLIEVKLIKPSSISRAALNWNGLLARRIKS